LNLVIIPEREGEAGADAEDGTSAMLPNFSFIFSIIFSRLVAAVHAVAVELSVSFSSSSSIVATLPALRQPSNIVGFYVFDVFL
jgi:hypothetical protein